MTPVEILARAALRSAETLDERARRMVFQAVVAALPVNHEIAELCRSTLMYLEQAENTQLLLWSKLR